MGDIFGGQKEDTSQQDAMNRQMAMQEKRIADEEKKQADMEAEEEAQRKLGRRGRRSLMSQENTGSGFLKSMY